MGKEEKTDAKLEDMILQRLVIGGVFVSVRKDHIGRGNSHANLVDGA